MKDKAIQLINKMMKVEDPMNSYPMCYETAKQCALILCDEFISFDIRAKSESQFVIGERIDSYWNEVKQEINKL